MQNAWKIFLMIILFEILFKWKIFNKSYEDDSMEHVAYDINPFQTPFLMFSCKLSLFSILSNQSLTINMCKIEKNGSSSLKIYIYLYTIQVWIINLYHWQFIRNAAGVGVVVAVVCFVDPFWLTIYVYISKKKFKLNHDWQDVFS